MGQFLLLQKRHLSALSSRTVLIIINKKINQCAVITFETFEHGRSQPKIKGGANFLKLIYSAVFNDGEKLEG